MKKTASLCCWNILFLWTILNTSVEKMCFTYDIHVPDNYTALNGDLDIVVIGLLRSPGETVRVELLEVEYVRSENKKLTKRDAEVPDSNFSPRVPVTSPTPSPPLEQPQSPPVNYGALIKFVDTRNESILYRNNNFSALNVSAVGNKPGTALKSLSRVLKTVETRVPRISVEKKWTVLGSVVLPERRDGNGHAIKVQFPCGVVTRGGHFGVRLTGHNETINNLTRRHRIHRYHKIESQYKIDEIEKNLSIVGLDVRWPQSVLSLSPHHVETYPDVAVSALLQFLPTKCSPARGAPVPETWLDLLFCGHSLVGCIEGNSTHRQVVYSEQIRGYPKRRSVVLRCELFGPAGYFALALRSSIQTDSVIETDNKDAYLKAVWSEHYIFNVHARSIFPCDVHGGGVPVLFQYPKCILTGDRVRLFSRLRADVSSLIPPTTLHYVTEQRVVKGKHSLQFDCDFFSEKYIEYCFVYVSQAITGAVSDVRMDCVPTLPIYDSESGNWGPWNAWSACTTTCGGGTRNRYRYCDSPPPKYGAKFCEGPSVETERCGNVDWSCEFYQNYLLIDSSESKGTDFPANRPEILAEVGPGCRCGCVVHLGVSKPRRLLATSSQSCPGRIFWQIEADQEHIIKFSVEHFRFPCGSQWLKVRDGDSRSSTLIGELSRSHTTSVPVVSSGSKLLVEFFSDELLASGQECWGGFLAHAQQARNPFVNNTSVSSGFSISNILRNLEVAPTASTSLFLIHSFIALFICLVILISGCLGIQYVFRYRKYQLAAAAEDADSVAGDSQSSLVAVRSRAASNSTLLSEVISLQRFKPVKKYKHSRLREEEMDMEEEQLSESSESQQGDMKTPTSSLKTLKPDADDESEVSSPVQMKKYSRTSCSPVPVSDIQTCEAFLKKPKGDSCRRLSVENGAGTSSLEGNAREKLHGFLRSRRESLSASSIKSGSTITNNFDSPSSSATSTATRNPKAKKERKNLEKLLAGSEFNLSEDGDLELDYYDYNVQNASAVPESYIGMDPAYLVWIPPFSPVNWEEEDEEIRVEAVEKADVGENETGKIRENINDDKEDAPSDSEGKKKMLANWRENARLDKQDLVGGADSRGQRRRWRTTRKTDDRGHYELANMTGEKETRVEKSPTENSDYYRVFVDIKFADDDDDDDDDGDGGKDEDGNDFGEMENCGKFENLPTGMKSGNSDNNSSQCDRVKS